MRLGFGIDEFIAGLEILSILSSLILKSSGIFYRLHERRLLLHPIGHASEVGQTHPKSGPILTKILADRGVFSEGILPGFFVVRL